MRIKSRRETKARIFSVTTRTCLTTYSRSPLFDLHANAPVKDVKMHGTKTPPTPSLRVAEIINRSFLLTFLFNTQRHWLTALPFPFFAM